MAQRNTIARALHDVGLAAWFGGSLMGAVGLDHAAAQLDDPSQRAHVVTTAWGRWGPVNAAAVAAHLAGSAQLTRANKARLVGQRGVGVTATAKTALTGLALAATGYIMWEGLRAAGGELPSEQGAAVGSTVDRDDRLGAVIRGAAGHTAPARAEGSSAQTETNKARARLRAAGWAVPAVTGALIVISAFQGEQQRAAQVAAGVLRGAPGRASLAVRGARRIPAGRGARAATRLATQRRYRRPVVTAAKAVKRVA